MISQQGVDVSSALPSKLPINAFYRIQSENFLPYLTGNKNLVPITRDLTYLR